MMRLRTLAHNGGTVVDNGPVQRLTIRPAASAYAVAQLDDYGGDAGGLRHRPGVALTVEARFSFSADSSAVGTAGFGFWNAPFADADIRRVALPQAAWFFFAAQPNYLPFPPDGPALGWFAGTVNARSRRALAIAPLAPLVLALNQWAPLRRRLWPWVRARLGISYTDLTAHMAQWHSYRLEWRQSACVFYVDGKLVQLAPHAPSGPMGLVCWVDNQYMALTPFGRIAAGTTPVTVAQSLEIRRMRVDPLH